MAVSVIIVILFSGADTDITAHLSPLGVYIVCLLLYFTYWMLKIFTLQMTRLV